jgi:hypothetical protein
MFEVLGFLKTGITIFQAGKAAYDTYGYVTGTSITHKVDNIHARLQRIEENIYFMYERELYRSNKSGILTPENSIVIPDKREVDAFINVHKEVSKQTSVIFSNIEQLPRGFLVEFNVEPDNFLVYQQDIGGGLPPLHFLKDDTLVPIQFLRDGRTKIGFMKKGYVEQVFGLTLKAALTEFRMANLNRDPFQDRHMRRNEVCYCGSGKRFKHCHGAFV